MTISSDKYTVSAPRRSEVQSFRDLHDLAEILESLGLQLHAKNRIALGESGYYWHMAETLRKLGRLANLPIELPSVDEKFGDAYTPGSLGQEEQMRRFFLVLQSVSIDDV